MRAGGNDDKTEAAERMQSMLSYHLITCQVARIVWLHLRDNAPSWPEAYVAEHGLFKQLCLLAHDASIPTADSVFRRPLSRFWISVEPDLDGDHEVLLRLRLFLHPEQGQFVNEPLTLGARFRVSFSYRGALGPNP